MLLANDRLGIGCHFLSQSVQISFKSFFGEIKRSLQRWSTTSVFCTNRQWCGIQTHLVWTEMAVGLPKGLSYPGTPLIQTILLPSERSQKGSTQPLRNRSTVFSLLLPPLCFCLPILLLLMSGNIHPNPAPIFPSFVCAGHVT